MNMSILRSCVLSVCVVWVGLADAEVQKPKIGLLLPFSGVYAHLGKATRDGFLMGLEGEGASDGSDFDYDVIQIDSKGKPSVAPELSSELLRKDRVDFIIGPVHSGVLQGMLSVLRNKEVIVIVPNAGAQTATAQLCAKNIFRTSFSSWQTGYPMGKVALDKGYKNIYTLSWNYTGGKEVLGGFKDYFENNGGAIVKEVLVPFPSTNFQPYISDIAATKPDAVFVFFAGGGAIEFVKSYGKMGLGKTIPLLGSGFLTEGTVDAQGESAEGILTTLHYAETLKLPKNLSFRKRFKNKFDYEADLYAVQGYDTGVLVRKALSKVGGDASDKGNLIEVIESLKFDSPRGNFKLSAAHNPVQNIYLREVKNGKNEVISVAMENLEDPAIGCELK